MFSSDVAEHYNRVEQKTVKKRNESSIIELRRFNNAMKSLMHHQAYKFAATIIRRGELFRILDLGCGKGGDLQKYLRSDKVGLVVGADIADVSIEQCIERYKSMKKSSRCFNAEFFVADLTRVDIKGELKKLKISEQFHIASTQFSLHYSFESYEQAVRYINNAADNLMRHGILIGTYPDGPKLLKLARESKTKGLYEVDDILSVKFSAEDLENPKPFGTKYHFKLKEAVDCPEFLVHPDVLRSLMNRLGFYEVFDRSFEENLKEAISNPNDGEIIKGIFNGHEALDLDPEKQIATLDENIWRAASMYRCFCYRKMRCGIC